ncbi:MAG: hypothetical protein H7840_12160 [Alphaproteobacteria bacterium]
MDVNVDQWLNDSLDEIFVAVEGNADAPNREAIAAAAGTFAVQLAARNAAGLDRLIATAVGSTDTSEAYGTMALEHTDLWTEERERFAGLVRDAFTTSPSPVPWAGLYLIVGFKGLVVRAVRRRLTPDTPLPAPSAFVYSMQ